MTQTTGRKLLSFLIALCMVVGLMPGMSLTARADGPVSYLEASWNETTKSVDYTEKTVSNPTTLASDTTAWTDGNWYVVPTDGITISSRITVTGTVNLILTDGKTLTASNGITVAEGNTLNIYAQSEGTGALTIANVSKNNAGIGGTNAKNGGTITINGGTITTTGRSGGAGIGGGANGTSGTITINGGTITATGGSIGGAGIGGGTNRSGGTITINGGTITATGKGHGAGIGGGPYGTGGMITINGGTITANSGTTSAGIGGGYKGASGAISINGGIIVANGNVGSDGSDGGAGIGGGEDGNNSGEGNSISITGGTVTATVPDGTIGAAIGNGGGTGGSSGTNCTVTIGDGATITAGAYKDGTGASSVTDVANNTTYKYACISFPTASHTHNFTYAATGATVTATCRADNCPLTDAKATLTIAPPSEGGNTAVFTGNTSEFDLTGVTITYQKKDSTGWQNMGAAPGNDDSGIFKASVTLKGTDNEEATAFVTYGVNAVSHGTVKNPEGKNYDFTVPKVAAVGAKITPTPTTELDTGYGIKKITVKDENQNDVSTSVEADTEGFIMPEYNVTVDVEFGLIDYTITINETSHGTVTANKNGQLVSETNPANYCDTVTLVATPDDGFALSSLTVKDSGDTAQEISGDGNTRTFTMPASNVTVSATFERAPYNLTIPDEITGGTVRAAGSGVETASSVTTAKAGSEVTLTVTPDTGFNLDSFTVTKTADNSAVSVTKESDTIYKFTMPTEAVTVSAAFVGKPVTASLNVTGNAGTDCTAAMLDENYNEIDSVTKKAGEKFILRISQDDGYDFRVTFSSGGNAGIDAGITEFTEDEYKAYVAYARENNISVPLDTTLAWVTMPGVANGELTVTVTFAKEKTVTFLYQTEANSDSDAVWCKFTTKVNNVDKDFAGKMTHEAVLGNVAVWSMKVSVAFDPTKVAFAATQDALENPETTMTNVTTLLAAPTGDSDWTAIEGNGKFVVIGGNAKTVIAAFVTDADALNFYDSEAVAFKPATAETGGVTYQIAVCGTDESGAVTSAGTVSAPAAPTSAPKGKEFAGWRGFKFASIDAGATEETYSAGAAINVRENTSFNAVWKPITLTVNLNLNGGTGSSSVAAVQYGESLTIPEEENPTREGFVFAGWAAGENVTENGVFFAKGSPFDLATPITANLKLTAQWEHVHIYTCYEIDDPVFNKKLDEFISSKPKVHVRVCGCYDMALEAHSFDSSGKCACGYQKPNTTDVTMQVAFVADGAYTQLLPGSNRTAARGQEVSAHAPSAINDRVFSKWQYSADNGTSWHDLAATPFVSFIIPCNTLLRALYINPVTQPQIDFTTSSYAYPYGTGTVGTVLYHMDYKLPDGYTFVDAGVRLGDNAGISYYELKERKRTAGEKAAWAGMNFVGGFIGGTFSITAGLTSVILADSLDDVYYYEKRENSVLDEMTADTLSDYMYQSKPVNVEIYPPIYWDTTAVTKGQSGSLNVVAPLKFIQKNNGDHYIYGIAYLRYKTPDGTVKTIYSEAIPATLNHPDGAASKSGS